MSEAIRNRHSSNFIQFRNVERRIVRISTCVMLSRGVFYFLRMYVHVFTTQKSGVVLSGIPGADWFVRRPLVFALVYSIKNTQAISKI